MGLERSSSTFKNVVTFATRKANLDCWELELEWTQCRNVTHEVDDGHFPLASCSRTFLCTSIFWKFVSECRVFVLSRVDWWRTFLTNFEEIHNNLSRLNCRSHRFGCLMWTVGGRSSRIVKRYTITSPS